MGLTQENPFGGGGKHKPRNEAPQRLMTANGMTPEGAAAILAVGDPAVREEIARKLVEAQEQESEVLRTVLEKLSDGDPDGAFVELTQLAALGHHGAIAMMGNRSPGEVFAAFQEIALRRDELRLGRELFDARREAARAELTAKREIADLEADGARWARSAEELRAAIAQLRTTGQLETARWTADGRQVVLGDDRYAGMAQRTARLQMQARIRSANTKARREHWQSLWETPEATWTRRGLALGLAVVAAVVAWQKATDAFDPEPDTGGAGQVAPASERQGLELESTGSSAQPAKGQDAQWREVGGAAEESTRGSQSPVSRISRSGSSDPTAIPEHSSRGHNGLFGAIERAQERRATYQTTGVDSGPDFGP